MSFLIFGIIVSLIMTRTHTDEFLRLFACIKHMPRQQVQELEGKLTGLRDHGENITLKLVDLENAWKEAPDAKLLSSLALYQALKHQIE